MASGGRTRRDFFQLCAGASTLWAGARAVANGGATPTHRYQRVRLVDADGAPVTAASLPVRREQLFFYPYLSTPCFLLRLDSRAVGGALDAADGRRYRAPAGVGDDASVVAFAAICAHKLSYPSRPVSFIGFRDRPVGYLNAERRVEQRDAVIQCCSEHSIYDPAAGARVLAGPARQPLTAIALEQDDDGALVAVGVIGGDLYPRFFERFGFQLDLEFDGRSRELASGSATVVDSADYSRQRIQC